MTIVPAARFEDAVTQGGREEIRRRVTDFVAACGVQSSEREQIARTLTAVLDAASGHAPRGDDVRIAVIADVMPSDVQLVLRLCPDGEPCDEGERIGGFELWISFPRD